MSSAVVREVVGLSGLLAELVGRAVVVEYSSVDGSVMVQFQGVLRQSKDLADSYGLAVMSDRGEQWSGYGSLSFHRDTVATVDAERETPVIKLS